MSRTFPGFCGGTYLSQSPNIDLEEAINVYCEISPAQAQAAKTPIALLLVPGKKIFAQVPEGSAPCLFTINGRLFLAASNLWELGQGNPINRGSLGSVPLGVPQICANQAQILILNNGNLFVFTLATNAFVAVNMAQFNGPVAQVDFADGYGIATIQNSNTFQMSNLEDFTTWQGLNIATVSLFPDNIVSMLCDHRELWLWSGKKSTVYYNAGAGFPPFIPVQGGFLEDGGGAQNSAVRADNSIFWIAADERGGGIAKRASGYGGDRISTHAVEYAWRQYATIADAVGWTYQSIGHTFVIWYFPTANATWAYDIATGLWHKRDSFNTVTGLYSADRAMSHAYFAGKHLVGDPFSGNVYELNENFFTDNGAPIRWLRRASRYSKENKFVNFPEIEIDVDNALGPIPPLKDAAGNPRSPQISLRWSNDAGKNWSNTYQLNCGQAGQTSYRARKTMCGRARRRVWEASGTDPIPWRISDAHLPGIYESKL